MFLGQKKKKNPSTIILQWKMETKNHILGCANVDPKEMSQGASPGSKEFPPGASVYPTMSKNLALGFFHAKIKSTGEEGSLLPRLTILGEARRLNNN